jgi:NAD(P)-dependent dehydrogenase (short-subunit alcohol dehydrogenase family)
MQTKLFENKVALITGATSGIGVATALAFAREGAKVVISGRREKEGNEILARIRKAGAEGLFVRMDVSNEAEVEALVSQTVSTFGRLDAAFNNAGVEGEVARRTHEQSAANYRTVMDINVLGVLVSMKYEISAMLKNGGGSIVNNSSIGGLVGFPGAGVYVASKHAVLGLTRSAALEYARERIRVNAVSPGPIETPMLDRFMGDLGAEAERHLMNTVPMGRKGHPEEIAEAVLWLCSDKGSFVTGQSLTVDGGYTAQ